MSPTPHRIPWAIDSLALAPGHRVLEIGCGTGMSSALICERLVTGHYHGIDRSEKMIAAARARNDASIRKGLATFDVADAVSARYPDARFDRVLAINVNLFWRQADAALERLRPLLSSSGRLHLVFEPPSATQLDAIAGACAERLRRHAFAVVALRRQGSCLEFRAEPGWPDARLMPG